MTRVTMENIIHNSSRVRQDPMQGIFPVSVFVFPAVHVQARLTSKSQPLVG